MSSDNERYFPYKLDNPDEKYTLPGSLEEVSGISYMEDGRIACVEDERGIIYIFDPLTGDVVHKNVFGKDGDYEDIAIVGKSAYVLRNDGMIFEVQDFESAESRIEIYNTALSNKNDTEGLAYDRQTHSLLITCKESPSLRKGDDFGDQEAVYCFDLQSKDLIKTPHFLFDVIRTGSNKDELVEFHASGISINPVNDEVYIISTRGKLLVVLDRQGKVLALQELKKKVFKQPEGICFSPSGELYISNEGRGKKGNILKFTIQ